MPTKSTSKSKAKKPQVKVADLKPAKDAKGGRHSSSNQSGSSSGLRRTHQN